MYLNYLVSKTKGIMQWLKELLLTEVSLQGIASGSARYINLTKAVAVFTLACFILTSVFQEGMASLAQDKREVKQFADVFKDFSIPHTAGRITQARCFNSDDVVVNIQDLHC